METFIGKKVYSLRLGKGLKWEIIEDTISREMKYDDATILQSPKLGSFDSRYIDSAHYFLTKKAAQKRVTELKRKAL